MARVTVRLEVPEISKAFEVAIETEADPAIVARGLAQDLNLKGHAYLLRPKSSLDIKDGSVLELLPEPATPKFSVLRELS